MAKKVMVSLNVKVEPVPEPKGFLASQSVISLIGIGLLGLVCVGLLFLVSRRIGEGDDSEWLDEEEEEF